MPANEAIARTEHEGISEGVVQQAAKAGVEDAFHEHVHRFARAAKAGFEHVRLTNDPDTETPMLEEENKIKPEETKLITGVVKTWSVEAVADCIMRGIARGAFAITPGAAITRDGREVGILTSPAESPRYGNIGLAILDKGFASEGTPVQVALEDGGTTSGTVAVLGIDDPTKEKPRA